MNKYLLTTDFISIKWYSFLLLVAVFLGMFLLIRESKKYNYPKEFIFNMCFWAIIIGFLGARAYYVIFNWQIYASDPISVFRIWEGGLAIYGGVISSIIFIIFYCKRKKKDIFLTLDTLVPYLILGQAIGRWGNFINKEAHGAITTYEHLKSLHIPNFIIDGMYINGFYYIPTFLYESLWCIVGFIILLLIRKKDNFKHKGLLLFIYFIWYGIGRLIIEGFRTDSLYLGTFRISQIVSIILIVIGVVGICIRRQLWKKEV